MRIIYEIGKCGFLHPSFQNLMTHSVQNEVTELLLDCDEPAMLECWNRDLGTDHAFLERIHVIEEDYAQTIFDLLNAYQEDDDEDETEDEDMDDLTYDICNFELGDFFDVLSHTAHMIATSAGRRSAEFWLKQTIADYAEAEETDLSVYTDMILQASGGNSVGQLSGDDSTAYEEAAEFLDANYFTVMYD